MGLARALRDALGIRTDANDDVEIDEPETHLKEIEPLGGSLRLELGLLLVSLSAAPGSAEVTETIDPLVNMGGLVSVLSVEAEEGLSKRARRTRIHRESKAQASKSEKKHRVLVGARNVASNRAALDQAEAVGLLIERDLAECKMWLQIIDLLKATIGVLDACLSKEKAHDLSETSTCESI